MVGPNIIERRWHYAMRYYFIVGFILGAAIVSSLWWYFGY
jgi:hypothetical protein